MLTIGLSGRSGRPNHFDVAHHGVASTTASRRDSTIDPPSKTSSATRPSRSNGSRSGAPNRVSTPFVSRAVVAGVTNVAERSSRATCMRDAAVPRQTVRANTARNSAADARSGGVLSVAMAKGSQT